jgi:hypothetical protein
MDERHERTFGPGSRLLIDQANTALSQVPQGSANVIHPQRNVMQAGTTALEKTGNRRFRSGGFEQLERRVSHRQEMRPHMLGFDIFRSVDIEAKTIAKERERRPNIAYRDPDVVEDSLHYSGQWSVVSPSVFSRGLPSGTVERPTVD